jgi:hypothetical protein
MSVPPSDDNYIGEPQYPAPWTTKKPRESLRFFRLFRFGQSYLQDSGGCPAVHTACFSAGIPATPNAKL